MSVNLTIVTRASGDLVLGTHGTAIQSDVLSKGRQRRLRSSRPVNDETMLHDIVGRDPTAKHYLVRIERKHKQVSNL